MHHFRALIVRHRQLAAVLVAMALLLKAVVPAGFMLDTGRHMLSVSICSDSLGLSAARHIVLPSSDRSHHGDEGKADSLCQFTVLGHATLGSADPVLLALELLFIFALGFLPLVAVQRARIAHILPPPCGPPALV